MTPATPARAVNAEAGAVVPRVPPPLYYGAAFAAGMGLHATSAPLSLDTGPTTVLAGGLILCAGAALALAGVVQVVRARTTIVPHRPVSALLTTGPYRLSRNPMYTGLAIAYLGGTLLTGSWWPLVTLPTALSLIRVWVIAPEERYLASRFSQTYADYRERTRRWL